MDTETLTVMEIVEKYLREHGYEGLRTMRCPVPGLWQMKSESF
jgi:hypothetical protein